MSDFCLQNLTWGRPTANQNAAYKPAIMNSHREIHRDLYHALSLALATASLCSSGISEFALDGLYITQIHSNNSLKMGKQSCNHKLLIIKGDYTYSAHWWI